MRKRVPGILTKLLEHYESVEAFARELGVSSMTVWRWNAEIVEPADRMKVAVNRLARAHGHRGPFPGVR